MTAPALKTALRACAAGLYPLWPALISSSRMPGSWTAATP